MLQDAVRTGTYHKAFISNPADFRGKVVVDVGTGSGILAFFAAKAGARKVYAIEASGVASQARKLMEANGLADKVEVIKGKVRCASETGGQGGAACAWGRRLLGPAQQWERLLVSALCARAWPRLLPTAPSCDHGSASLAG